MTGALANINEVFLFAVHFWRPHLAIMALSAVLILLSTSMNIVIPQLAQEVATFDSNTQDADKGQFWLPVLISAPPGLVSRCALLAAVIVLYHTTSFAGHKMAYLAGQRIHNTILETVLFAILTTPHLDRISSVNPVKLGQVILSSAKTSADVVGALLTDVLSSLCGAVVLLGLLLHMSARLTLTIGVVFMSSQLVLLGVRRKQHNRSKELALAESNVQALTTNALHRSVTVRVFHAKPLIMSGLRERLQHLSSINEDVVTAIHGQTGVSSAVTRLLFVLVLGITNSYRQRGELGIVDIAMYYMFMYQFINRTLSLVHEYHRAVSLLEGLHTLQQLVVWYGVEHVVRQELAASHPEVSIKETVNQTSVEEGSKSDGATTTLDSSATAVLENVSYVYPEVPSFLVDATEKDANSRARCGPNESDTFSSTYSNSSRGSGIHDVTLTIEPEKITVLYGSSGAGKSTCLRLLAGLLQPLKGTVRTHSKVALLEQQQAVLLGTVADNILMEDTSTFSKAKQEKARHNVNLAMRQSGCQSFLGDPFRTVIHSPDRAQFSGGQLQRICMARLYAHQQCTLLLLDEPTTGLDAPSVEHLLATLTELNKVHHKTIVVASHDTRVSAIAHNIIDMQDTRKNQ
ncbi:ABC transporter-like protein [Trypanosoma grayi]|uniref:ABC transporter-like protein n=1 Tax=Trypanosoma grayi TaxID=71804 RepID=UPI0004F48945|nr:ABC transporter-like protein [Trypanosoma grayi]KEG08474.1 ABC transporter-like protein [Trypanosoma grayi]